MFTQLNNDPEEWNTLFLPEVPILKTERFWFCALFFTFGVLGVIRLFRHASTIGSEIIGIVLTALLLYLAVGFLGFVIKTRRQMADSSEQSTFLLANARDQLRQFHYRVALIAISLNLASLWN